MEREQATLPFVVPSHLSKLFGLKASVIVEGEGVGGGGGEWETEKNKEREKEAVPGANSTCWGDGETAVVEGGGGGDTGAHSFFYSFYACFCKRLSIDSCSSSSPYLHPAVNRFPEGYSGFWVKALGLLSYWLSGSVEDSRTEQGKDSGKTKRKKWEVDLARSSALIPRCVFFANVCSL